MSLNTPSFRVKRDFPNLYGLWIVCHSRYALSIDLLAHFITKIFQKKLILKKTNRKFPLLKLIEHASFLPFLTRFHAFKSVELPSAVGLTFTEEAAGDIMHLPACWMLGGDTGNSTLYMRNRNVLTGFNKIEQLVLGLSSCPLPLSSLQIFPDKYMQPPTVPITFVDFNINQ